MENSNQQELSVHHNHEEHGHSHGHHHGGHVHKKILTIRSHSGLSGDMLLAGLLCLSGTDQSTLNGIVEGLLGSVVPDGHDIVRLERKEVQHIAGWHCSVNLPKQHEHRNLSDILTIVARSPLCEEAKRMSKEAFELLARAEANVHGKSVEEVHFHEVGALDSIVDTCLACEFFVRLGSEHCIVSPLPLADGSVLCAHGILPVPAPAVLSLLPGLAVSSFAGTGETLTPTAAALLHVLPVEFGAWPRMRVHKTALVYGDIVFPDVPNGATFALGESI